MKSVPFHIKILGSFLTLLAAVLAASLVLVNRDQTREAEADIAQHLRVTRDVFYSVLERREKQLAAALSILGEDFAFKRALATRDPDTIASAAVTLQGRVGADILMIADETGTTYADTSGVFEPGRSAADFPLIAKALDEEAGTAIQVLNGVPCQLAAVPVYAPDLIGLLMAGFRIDDHTASEIKRLTLSELSFETSGAIFASTLPPEDRAVLQETAPGLTPEQTHVIGPPGRRQVVLPFRPSPHVAAFIQRPWDQALEPVRLLREKLLLIGFSGFALFLLAGFLIAGGVTTPLRVLAAATRRLGEGDYGVRVDVRQRDEIGQLGDAFNRMVEGLQEREKIRSVLRKAVSKEIADELLKRGQINLGGEERGVTVLFSDIRGFTTISEKLPPGELVSQLNEYFIAMAKAIERHGGVIDKYIGDAIMALFGAPLATPADAGNALRAALAMTEALGRLNGDRAARGLPPWENGVGVNTGRAVAGTMGSEDRWSYTVIGDAVNLASRLEGLTKHYGARVLASEAARAAAGDGFLFRSLDLVRVKGRSEPVPVYELLGERASPPAWLAPFEDGVRAYRSRDFAAARSRFKDVLGLKPDDPPALLYQARLEALPSSLPPDWDPAHTMTEK